MRFHSYVCLFAFVSVAILPLPALAHEADETVLDPGFRPYSEYASAFVNRLDEATIAVHPTLIRSYRGMVIKGLIHNDDPNAEAMWMPTGSFWTQPSGDAHITEARGTDTLAYIEIEDGPYLVRHVEQAFQSEGRPMNLDASNVVWLNASDVAANAPIDAPSAADGSKIAFLWGNPQDDGPSGILVKLQPRSACVMRSRGSTVRAVVIQGSPAYQATGGSSFTVLGPGCYIGANGASARISCESGENCILYVRMED